MIYLIKRYYRIKSKIRDDIFLKQTIDVIYRSYYNE